jgi:hypothetical protein
MKLQEDPQWLASELASVTDLPSYSAGLISFDSNFI